MLQCDINFFVVCILLCVMYTIYKIGVVQHNNIFRVEHKIDTNLSTVLFLFIAHATCRAAPIVYIVYMIVWSVSISVTDDDKTARISINVTVYSVRPEVLAELF
jgi:hypothetical protein